MKQREYTVPQTLFSTPARESTHLHCSYGGTPAVANGCSQTPTPKNHKRLTPSAQIILQHLANIIHIHGPGDQFNLQHVTDGKKTSDADHFSFLKERARCHF